MARRNAVRVKFEGLKRGRAEIDGGGTDAEVAGGCARDSAQRRGDGGTSTHQGAKRHRQAATGHLYGEHGELSLLAAQSQRKAH